MYAWTPVAAVGLLSDFHVEATAFLHEIIRAADCLRDASTFDGASALQLGPRWRLLRAIERCGGAPTFSDLGRLLDMSRQGAREQALEAAEAGVVELFPAHDDRRALQVMLTPAGRRALEAQRMPRFRVAVHAAERARARRDAQHGARAARDQATSRALREREAPRAAMSARDAASAGHRLAVEQRDQPAHVAVDVPKPRRRTRSPSRSR